MACFLVSAAEAAVVKAAEKNEERKELLRPEAQDHAKLRIPMSVKLRWLSVMLWGGAALLMFEHIWHGEITAHFPFLTAMSTPSDMAVMLHEMATVGVCMALAVTGVWAVMCMAADAILRRASHEEAAF